MRTVNVGGMNIVLCNIQAVGPIEETTGGCYGFRVYMSGRLESISISNPDGGHMRACREAFIAEIEKSDQPKPKAIEIQGSIYPIAHIERVETIGEGSRLTIDIGTDRYMHDFETTERAMEVKCAIAEAFDFV